MVAKKRKSKRQTLQQKYKIVKRVKEHHKRLKKGRLNNATAKKKTQDNHIPNAWPYKEQLLKEIQAAKEKMEEAKLRQKEKRKEELAKRRGISTMDVETTPAESKNLKVVANALERTDDDLLDAPVAAEEDGSKLDHSMKALGQNSRRAFLGELKKLIERSDVILQVLDARDPLGTKSQAVEDMVLSNYRKRLVYVLNKADMVPRQTLEDWLAYLRKSHPTVPFKSNTQSQKGHLGITSGKVSKSNSELLSTSQAVGVEELLNILKNYCRVGEAKHIITVGIVGFPNVGKSSLINSLTRSRSVGVSPMPGFTKVAQEVILDKNIRLIDSPGIVFADGQTAATALRNCVNVDTLADVITPVQAILDRCPASYLMQVYNIPKFPKGDALAFLALVSRVRGLLKKGGVPNVEAAGRSVLHDWNGGKIKYYTKPPKAAAAATSDKETVLMPAYTQELDLAALQESDVKVLTVLYDQTAKPGKAGKSADRENGMDDLYVGMESVGEQLVEQMEE